MGELINENRSKNTVAMMLRTHSFHSNQRFDKVFDILNKTIALLYYNIFKQSETNIEKYGTTTIDAFYGKKSIYFSRLLTYYLTILIWVLARNNNLSIGGFID